MIDYGIKGKVALIIDAAYDNKYNLYKRRGGYLLSADTKSNLTKLDFLKDNKTNIYYNINNKNEISQIEKSIDEVVEIVDSLVNEAFKKKIKYKIELNSIFEYAKPEIDIHKMDDVNAAYIDIKDPIIVWEGSKTYG